ncbi:hypothetical protein [Limisphaera sp. VF-2]|uniref:hypothetical protein n=1 Tax=Limisphaera sp. VF-2 TaxID=3400418 RepID=UPI00176B794F
MRYWHAAVARIAVVHLVREAHGPAPFEAFLRAYRRHPAGVEHDLIFVWKGFRDLAVLDSYRRRAADLVFQAFSVRDWGYDIRAYGVALRRLSHEYFCFLNSFSEPLVADWLALLFRHAQQPDVGLAGATGSWESMYRNCFLPSPPGLTGAPPVLRWRFARRILCRVMFPPFPNWHVRTNAFVVRRSLALECWPRWIFCKRHAYLFENGRWSLTRRILARGLRVVVVGRDGRAYLPQEWPGSRTYRSGRQENLLVADRQTRAYEEADPATRHWLADLAWGEAAVPAS